MQVQIGLGEVDRFEASYCSPDSVCVGELTNILQKFCGGTATLLRRQKLRRFVVKDNIVDRTFHYRRGLLIKNQMSTYPLSEVVLENNYTRMMITYRRNVDNITCGNLKWEANQKNQEVEQYEKSYEKPPKVIFDQECDFDYTLVTQDVGNLEMIRDC
uniref:Uncharacterized protein n=1 Tax=Romanomermis culicivorax TaxID=13658 RepID=A0A915J5P7_ROMCU